VKDILSNLNKAFENRVRLAVMSLLTVNESLEFNKLKEMLDLTDGNLASHIAMLEKNRYISVKKKFVGKKPMTTYSATALGKKAFAEHLDALEALIQSIN
jgi:DNA-binding MarR family transcriptional regulator